MALCSGWIGLCLGTLFILNNCSSLWAWFYKMLTESNLPPVISGQPTNTWLSAALSRQLIHMQSFALPERDFSKETLFLPTAAINNLEVQLPTGFKGQQKILPRLPAARQLSAGLLLWGERGLQDAKHPSAVFWVLAGAHTCFGVWPLICLCLYKETSSGVPAWALGKLFG